MPNQQNGNGETPKPPKTFDRTLRPWQTNPTLGPAFIKGAQVRELTPEEEEHFLYNFREGLREDLAKLPEILSQPKPKKTNCEEASPFKDVVVMARRLFTIILEKGYLRFADSIMHIKWLASQSEDIEIFLNDSNAQELLEAMWDAYVEQDKMVESRGDLTICDLLKEERSGSQSESASHNAAGDTAKIDTDPLVVPVIQETPKPPKTFDRTLRPWQTNPTLGPAFIDGAQRRDLTPEEEEHFLYNIREGMREDLAQLPEILKQRMKPTG